MRGPQQGGRAEAEDENGDGQRDGGDQEAEAGEHFWVRFRHGGPAAGALEPKWNAVITAGAGLALVRRRESGLIQEYRKRCSAFVKKRCCLWCRASEDAISAKPRLYCHGIDGTSQFAEMRSGSDRFVLNAPRSSAMCS